MKKIVFIAMSFLAFQICAAQGPNKGQRGMNLTAEEMATLRTKKMTLSLDLDKSQQEQVYAIHLENAKLRKTYMAEQNAARLNNQGNRNPRANRYDIQNKMLDRKIAVKAKMNDILNKEQFDKWEKIQTLNRSKTKSKNKKKPGRNW